jgi:hypothetical protein
MKMQVQYCESFRTFLGYNKYTIDTKNFPEIEDMSSDETTQWIAENMENLSVKENDDGKPEIVPFDSNLPDLQTDATDRGVVREKTLDNEAWFEYLGNYDEEDETTG